MCPKLVHVIFMLVIMACWTIATKVFSLGQCSLIPLSHIFFRAYLGGELESPVSPKLAQYVKTQLYLQLQCHLCVGIVLQLGQS